MAVLRHITDMKKLKLLANTIRQDIISMLEKAGSGHSAGSLGMTDVFTALYFAVANHDPKKPGWAERDRVVLSNGHICPVLYATLARAGYFSLSVLGTLRKLGSPLQGHPHRTALPGLETSSGPLGSGLSQTAGMALASLMDNHRIRIFCLMGDGEQNEGQVWESVMFAAKYKLHNLTVIIDRNNIQIDGHTEDVMPLDSLSAKYSAFGWHVLEVDGHNIRQVIDALHESAAVFEKPTVIIAHTVPGKGVSFMENDPEWHGKPPTQAQAKVALVELVHERKLIKRGEV